MRGGMGLDARGGLEEPDRALEIAHRPEHRCRGCRACAARRFSSRAPLDKPLARRRDRRCAAGPRPRRSGRRKNPARAPPPARASAASPPASSRLQRLCESESITRIARHALDRLLKPPHSRRRPAFLQFQKPEPKERVILRGVGREHFLVKTPRRHQIAGAMALGGGSSSAIRGSGRLIARPDPGKQRRPVRRPGRPGPERLPQRHGLEINCLAMAVESSV